MAEEYYWLITEAAGRLCCGRSVSSVLEFGFQLYILLGHAVAQLIEALRYKSEGRGFDSRWRHWNFFLLTLSSRLHYGSGVDSASNRKEYQEYFLGVEAAGA